MARAPSFCGVILAAGESSRMGRDKALLPWQSTTLLAAGIDLLAPYTDLVIVVAGKNADSIAPVVYAKGGFLVTNPEPELGQFSSLRVGVQAVLDHGRDAAILNLVDRPPSLGATVQMLQEAFLRAYQQDKWAVIPEYQGKHGHPVAVGREMIEQFLRAPATSSARDVLHANQQHIQYLPVEDAGILANIDTPEQFQQITKA